MYAKVFTQIFDSSIADNWKVRHVFEDMLKLCNQEGVCDMTHEAIAARTRIPLKLVREAITQLEMPDPRSRSPLENGVRLKRLNEHRDWGWWIVNYETYRGISTDSQYREKNRERVKRFRAKHAAAADVTLRNVTEEKERYGHVTSPYAYTSPSPSASDPSEGVQGGRLHGIPATVEEVIAYGATMYPKKPEPVCRAFFFYYEGQARTNPSGAIFWVTKGEAIVTNWKAKLAGFEGQATKTNQPNQSNYERSKGQPAIDHSTTDF